MPNNIAFARNYTSVIDEVYQRASVSGVLNSGLRMVRASHNAKEILIPKISVTGLGDYTRNVGYKTGGIDGEPGDQTGRESWVHDCYSGSWDGILHYNGKADVGSASTPTGSGAPSGDVSELAARVIAGDFGNGDARRAALGSRCDEVQAEVNRILSGGSSSSSYDVDALARRVIAGEFGNGDARKQLWGRSTRPCRSA